MDYWYFYFTSGLRIHLLCNLNSPWETRKWLRSKGGGIVVGLVAHTWAHNVNRAARSYTSQALKGSTLMRKIST